MYHSRERKRARHKSLSKLSDDDDVAECRDRICHISALFCCTHAVRKRYIIGISPKKSIIFTSTFSILDNCFDKLESKPSLFSRLTVVGKHLAVNSDGRCLSDIEAESED
jgi:hypothetical protein